ncbi:transcription factor Opi1-domain-containing protein [Mycena galopus ATCC 62051]|nr:transcription factor Opi1-domain-containing protein [Mycena galopus ATCC 62051]
MSKKKTLDGDEYDERDRDRERGEAPGPYEPYDARGERAYEPVRRYGGYDEDERGGKRRYEHEAEYEGEQQHEREREREGEGERQREEGRGKPGSSSRVPGWLEATSPFVPPPGPPPPLGRSKARDAGVSNGRENNDKRESSRGSARERERDGEGGAGSSSGGEERQVAVGQRSRWQAVLLEAGGLSAALSDESMRRLRYCLSWLQYATQHIDAQILILRDFIASLHPLPPPGSNANANSSSLTISTSASATGPALELTPDHLRTLAHLRSDIVHTIRQVVGVVSKYAGGALPEPARGTVRGFILDLPKRFSAEGGGGGVSPGGASASASGVAAGTGGGGATRRGAGAARSQRGTGGSERERAEGPSPTPSAPGSPHTHLRPLHGHGHSRRGSVAGGPPVEAGKALAAAQRVLTLATESLDMMRGVTAVVGDSLDRADAWVDRLRTVGIQRGMDGLALPDGNGEHGHWAGATPAWPGPPRSPGDYTSTSGARSPAYGSAGYASGARSPTTYVASGHRPGSPYASGAPSPGFGLGGMSLGSSRYSTPAGEEERDRERERERERDREEGEGRMDVDG